MLASQRIIIAVMPGLIGDTPCFRARFIARRMAW